MRRIPCFEVDENEQGYGFSLLDKDGLLLHSVTSKNEAWRNIRMHMLNECVMRNRVFCDNCDGGKDGPIMVCCQSSEGFQIRFYSALGNELAYTNVYADKQECMKVYEWIRMVLKKEHVLIKFYR